MISSTTGGFGNRLDAAMRNITRVALHSPSGWLIAVILFLFGFNIGLRI